jgi:hypothetical protein
MTSLRKRTLHVGAVWLGCTVLLLVIAVVLVVETGAALFPEWER